MTILGGNGDDDGGDELPAEDSEGVPLAEITAGQAVFEAIREVVADCTDAEKFALAQAILEGTWQTLPPATIEIFEDVGDMLFEDDDDDVTEEIEGE